MSWKPSVGTRERNVDESNIIRINLPFKDQVSANSVRRQLLDLSNKIGLPLQPVFVSKKLEQDLKPREAKPSIVNQRCVVYHFICDLCDADYVGYTARQLMKRSLFFSLAGLASARHLPWAKNHFDSTTVRDLGQQLFQMHAARVCWLLLEPGNAQHSEFRPMTEVSSAVLVCPANAKDKKPLLEGNSIYHY